MRNALFAVVFALVPSAVLAIEAVEVNARDHSCAELAQIIRHDKAVFVRAGFGGHSFRAAPAQCSLGDKRAVARIRDRSGALCVLDQACVYDPNSFYNWDVRR